MNRDPIVEEVHRIREQMWDDCGGSLDRLIESLRANLPVSVLIIHDRMQGTGKKSVAEVHHGVCAGCHLGLGIGNVAALRRGDLQRCGNCGRYLYLVEEDAAESQRPVTKRRTASRTVSAPVLAETHSA